MTNIWKKNTYGSLFPTEKKFKDSKSFFPLSLPEVHLNLILTL